MASWLVALVLLFAMLIVPEEPPLVRDRAAAPCGAFAICRQLAADVAVKRDGWVVELAPEIERELTRELFREHPSCAFAHFSFQITRGTLHVRMWCAAFSRREI